MSNEPNQATTSADAGSRRVPDSADSQPPTASGPVHAVSKETRRRVIAASFIGNFVEWFDYAVYGYLAVTIAAVFFPNQIPRQGSCSLSPCSPSRSWCAPSEASCGATLETGWGAGTRSPCRF